MGINRCRAIQSKAHQTRESCSPFDKKIFLENFSLRERISEGIFQEYSLMGVIMRMRTTRLTQTRGKYYDLKTFLKISTVK